MHLVNVKNGGRAGTEDLWLEVEEFIPTSQEWHQLMMIRFRRWASQYLKCHTHLSSEKNVVIADQYVERTANMAKLQHSLGESNEVNLTKSTHIFRE
jgi:hypothetical protein